MIATDSQNVAKVVMVEYMEIRISGCDLFSETYKTTNFRGLITKIPVGIKAKQMINMTIAARLSAPKISRRSHRLTIGKNQPRTGSLSRKEPGHASRESTRGMQEPIPCHRPPTIRRGAGDRPGLDKPVWRTYMRTTLPPPLAARVLVMVLQDFHVSAA
jgi:hypothetical protein